MFQLLVLQTLLSHRTIKKENLGEKKIIQISKSIFFILKREDQTPYESILNYVRYLT
ncbi:hypothetical protein pb186bvf_003415 [Paramecium bursaria]